jgi:hypothetical protein
MLEDVLRHEPPLGGDAIVVRGGLLGYDPVITSFQQCWDKYHFYGLTVWHDPNRTPTELWNEIVQLASYGAIRTARVATLREHGFEVFPTLGRFHHSIVIGQMPNLLVWQLLDDSFNETLRR